MDHILDCGCVLHEKGGRSWCPTCAEGGPRGAASSERARRIEADGVIALARGAMTDTALCSVIIGQAPAIAAWARKHRKPNPLRMLQSAHAKAVEYCYRYGI